MQMFQRIAKRDKKAFLSDQCKEIEENNRMGKTRDLFRKIRDTKGTFHAKTPWARSIHWTLGSTVWLLCAKGALQLIPHSAPPTAHPHHHG